MEGGKMDDRMDGDKSTAVFNIKRVGTINTFK